MIAIPIALLLAAPAEPAPPPPPQARYADLVTLFAEWRAFQAPAMRDGVADFTAAAMDRQRADLAGWQERLAALDPSSWTVEQKIDHAIVTAEMNGLDFDHRVLRPWSSDPAFYRLLHDGETDVPRREGPVHPNSVEIWRYSFPLAEAPLQDLTRQVSLLPAVLKQARANLAGDARQARDLWALGIRIKKEESATLGDLAARASAASHQAIASALLGAREAVDAFRAWLEQELPGKRNKAGIGIADYNWDLWHVQLVPMTWAEEVALHERELGRARAALALLEHQNRNLPPLVPVTDPADWERVSRAGVVEFIAFLRRIDIMPVRDYFDQALLERRAGFVPPEGRDFFMEVAIDCGRPEELGPPGLTSGGTPCGDGEAVSGERIVQRCPRSGITSQPIVGVRGRLR